MQYEALMDWFDKFHREFIESRRVVRGYIYSGAHLEIYDSNEISVIMEVGMKGTNDIDKAKHFVKTVFDKERQQIEAVIPVSRMEKIIAGDDLIRDEDWRWPDEF